MGDLELKQVNETFESFLSTLGREYNHESIRSAFEFAKKAHMYQHRKSGEPFVYHPLEVAKIVAKIGLDTTSVVAALLHDIVEDTPTELKEIRTKFGDEVELLVEGLTKIQVFGEQGKDKDIESLRKILLASAKDVRILIIKLCDRLHNMRTLGTLDADRRFRISAETLHIYAPIAQKVGLYSLKWELEDLSLKYQNPEMYAFIKEKLGLSRSERENIVLQAVEEIKSILEANGLSEVLVLGRPKNFFSIYKKIKERAKAFEEIHDLYAIRIIAKEVGQCYSILGLLHEHLQAFPDRLKDYIANPKANGYQSLHTVLYSRKIKSPIEVQIRTEEMHKVAEFGLAAHWKYKTLGEDKKFEEKIAWLREFLQWEKEHHDNTEFMNLLKFNFFENEIFVFTPKNDVHILPESATVLDFAYAVHSEVGNAAQKAKVNGLLTTIDRELRSGDVVQIVTNMKVRPTEKWLSLVKTSRARIAIKSALQLKSSMNPNKKKEDNISPELLLSQIAGTENYKKVRFAGCCRVEPGCQLTGVVLKTGELAIHDAGCENAKYTPNKKFPLQWREIKNKEISIYIHLKYRHGLIVDIMSLLTEFNVSFSKLNTKRISREGDVRIELSLEDGPFVENLVSKLRALDAAVSVKVSRGLFG